MTTTGVIFTKDGTQTVTCTGSPSLQSGSVTLAAGTSGPITVTGLTTSGRVRLTNNGTGGTVGTLSAALNAGSLTINSSNAADTSTVFYEVVQY